MNSDPTGRLRTILSAIDKDVHGDEVDEFTLADRLNETAAEILQLAGYDPENIHTDVTLAIGDEHESTAEAYGFEELQFVTVSDDDPTEPRIAIHCGLLESGRVHGEKLYIGQGGNEIFFMCESASDADLTVLLSNGFVAYRDPEGMERGFNFSDSRDDDLDMLLDDLSSLA